MKRIFGILMVLALCVSVLGVGALPDEGPAADEDLPVSDEAPEEEVSMESAQTHTVEVPASASFAGTVALTDEEPAADGDLPVSDEAPEEETGTESVQTQTAAAPVAANFAGTVALTVTADKSEVKAGDTVTFTISVSGAADSGIAALAFEVRLPDELEVTSSAVKCANLFALANYNESAACFTGTATATLDGINTANWTVMTLTCTVKSGEPGAKSVTLSDVVLSDGSADPISYTVQSAAVTLTHDHVWGSGKVTKEATCKEKGETTYTCTVCGETKTEEIPAQDHVWDEGKVTKEATATAKGEKTYTCTVCGETKTEEIPMLQLSGSGTAGNKGKVKSPQTGDETNIALWAALMTVCAAGAAAIALRKKEH